MKNSGVMQQELKEELDLLSEILSKSGFFDKDGMLEIIEDQFIDDKIDLNKIDIPLIDALNSNFSRLEEAFIQIAKTGILTIHNCGYDVEEALDDVFELLVHIQNNDYDARGFCFYTFEDVEESIYENKLSLHFGDFKQDRSEILKMGREICEILKAFNFNVSWSENIDDVIVIDPFNWDKKFNPDKEYEIEGAFDVFINNQV